MHEKHVKGILSSKNGMNLYRGCTHGCIYCDSRSTCYQMNHDFEDVEVKVNAPQLLEKALRSKRKKRMIATGAMSDPYIHEEKQRGLTRRCLELIEHYGFGLAIQTKSDLILRDLDLLKSINKNAKCVVQMTLTTYDENLCAILEPNVCTTKRRVEVLKIMHEEGIPTIVWLTPILPFINDTQENVEGLLDYCIQANFYGILCFNMGLTLRDGDREYYYQQLDKYFPGLKERYIKRYGNAYEILSPNSHKLLQMVQSTCKERGMICDTNALFSYMHTLEEKKTKEQLSLF
ncbi:MAG: radical SAM protein [Thermotogota bacterium]|nr:radical SAM protein [Thermotogota bacterium]